MGTGDPFTFADYLRWPSGAEKAELIAGGPCFAGSFTADDVSVARRTYPDHEVYLDEIGLWVLPAGTGSVAAHLTRSDAPPL